jgi:UDP-N-acetylglucosamine 2-epimerase (hydrolysing)
MTKNSGVHKSLMVFGTRPEIIKLGPVYRALIERDDAIVHAFWTGQHVELAEGLLELFEIEITYHADASIVMAGLSQKTGAMLEMLGDILGREQYDSMIVQGDTVTAMAGAICGFLHRVPVAHVEAGLRTFNMMSPWPEEFARRVISLASVKHFAPTHAARHNLLNEGISSQNILVTGNTVVDALQYVSARMQTNYVPISREIDNLPADKKLILVTGHRRENFGEPLRAVMEALRQIADDGDKYLVFPVHLNPIVRKEVFSHLDHHPNIRLVEPLRYPDFIHLLSRAWTVITDSGGIQEEAPAFRIPIVITRDTTERPEVVEAGFGHLVGCATDTIVERVRYLTSGDVPTRVAGENPFGTGDAGYKIASALVGSRVSVPALAEEQSRFGALMPHVPSSRH